MVIVWLTRLLLVFLDLPSMSMTSASFLAELTKSNFEGCLEEAVIGIEDFDFHENLPILSLDIIV